MALENELEILDNYIRRKNLKHSEQRMQILEVLSRSNRHFTAEELYNVMKKKFKGIGSATIYRTLKLLCECGLCRELRLEDGVIRYEAMQDHEHHDHLICVTCGKFIEVLDSEIERLQQKLAQKHGFKLVKHRLNMYGICQECFKSS